MTNKEKIDKIIECNKLKLDLVLKIKSLEISLRNTCDKKCGFYLIGEDYNPGSYYDKASTKYYMSCNICGAYETLRKETHSLYD